MTGIPATDAVDRALWALQAYNTIALGTMGATGPNVAAEFFAPRGAAGGIRLVLGLLRDCRNHRDIGEDNRVAFMCSPGNTSRWVQGRGTAAQVDDPPARYAMFEHLIRHAPGAQPFIDHSDVVAVEIAVRSIKVVTDIGQPPITLTLR